jgi:hypothetical protein
MGAVAGAAAAALAPALLGLLGEAEDEEEEAEAEGAFGGAETLLELVAVAVAVSAEGTAEPKADAWVWCATGSRGDMACGSQRCAGTFSFSSSRTARHTPLHASTTATAAPQPLPLPLLALQQPTGKLKATPQREKQWSQRRVVAQRSRQRVNEN